MSQEAKPEIRLDFSTHIWRSWSDTIREVREQTRMDQEEFGRFLGDFTRFQISRFERRQTPPPLPFWRAFATTFKLNLNYVIMGFGDPMAESDFDPKAIEKRRKVLKKNLQAAEKREQKELEQERDTWDRLRQLAFADEDEAEEEDLDAKPQKKANARRPKRKPQK